MIREPQNSQIAIGLFDSRAAAEAAVVDLEGAGFNSTDVGVAARNDTGAWSDLHTPADQPRGGEGAATGAAAGAGVGAGVGGLWALGIAAGALPAIGPVIAGGLLASILASVATGAAAGGLMGGLIGLGLPEADARFYETEVARGRIIVTVRAEDRFAEASQILQTHGAYDVRAATAIPV